MRLAAHSLAFIFVLGASVVVCYDVQTGNVELQRVEETEHVAAR